MNASISHGIRLAPLMAGLLFAGSGAADVSPGDAPSSNTLAARHFEIHGALAADPVMHLLWQRCSVGQRWAGDGCVGVVRQMSWQDAKRLEKDGWRLPTRDELMRLVEPSAEPSIDEQVFPDIEFNKLWYWSGSASGSSAWYIAFGGGSAHLAPQDNRNAVRLVKGG